MGFCRGAGTLSDTGVLVPSPRSGAMVVLERRRRRGLFDLAPDADVRDVLMVVGQARGLCVQETCSTCKHRALDN